MRDRRRPPDIEVGQHDLQPTTAAAGGDGSDKDAEATSVPVTVYTARTTSSATKSTATTLGEGPDGQPRWVVGKSAPGVRKGASTIHVLVRLFFLLSLAVIAALCIVAMVVVTQDLHQGYQSGLSLFYSSLSLFYVETSVASADAMLANPNNAAVLRAGATALNGLLLVYEVYIPSLIYGNASIGLTNPPTSSDISAELANLTAHGETSVAAVNVIQQAILVDNAQSLSPPVYDAIYTILADGAAVTPIIRQLDINIADAALDQNQQTQQQQYILMGVILGVLLLLALFVYIPVERRIKRLVDKLVINNEDIARFATNLTILTQLSPNGIFRVDHAGTLTYANDKWRDIVGFGPDATMAELDTWASRIHPESYEAVMHEWRQILSASSSAVSIEFQMLRPVPPEQQQQLNTPKVNGVPLPVYEVRWVHLQCQPEVVHTETVGGTTEVHVHSVVGSLADITERHRLEKERMDALQLAASQAEEHRAEQARFVDIICHEIRNPLNGIVNSADVLRGTHKTITKALQSETALTKEQMGDLLAQIDETRDLWDAIELCVNHQRRITDDVLQLSRLRVGRFTLVHSALSIRHLIDSVAGMFRAEAEAAGIALTCHYSPACDRVPRLGGDPQRIVQVLINLVGNAIKFTRNATTTRRVTIDVDIKPPVPTIVGGLAHVVFKVQDTGIGLTEEERGRLFVPFGQANIKTYSQYGGSGMGLFISKALLDLMGGTVDVASVPGEGCTFTVVIPCERLANETPLDFALVPGPSFSNMTASASESLRSSRRESEVVKPIPPEQQRTGESTEAPAVAAAPAAAPAPAAPAAAPAPAAPAAAPAATAATVEQQAAAVAVEQEAATTGAAAAAAPATPRQFRVLVVEDNDINQRILRRQFEMVPNKLFAVSAVSNGQEAVDLCASNSYDLIIMDVEMPVMGGLDATRHIRRMAEESHRKPCKIIGLSGNAREEHVQLGLAAGMDNYLAKPCRKRELLSAAQDALSITKEELGPLE